MNIRKVLTTLCIIACSIIAKAQEPDGYLTTCVTNKCTRLSGWWGKSKWEKINSHELYNSGHMIESAVAHYKATGKRTFLNVAIRNADLICKTFGPAEGQIHRPSGHPIVEMALCKLYLVTNNKRDLDMARYFVEETGRGTDGHRLSEYSQDHKPILTQDEIVGHAVRAGYLYSGVADVASLTGDTAYFHALERIWDNMASKKLFITGGIGSGKSHVCRLLAKRGIRVYDCDAAAKRLMRDDAQLRQQLTELVGPRVYINKVLQKPVLTQFLLASEANKQAVNAVVHPAVARDFLESDYPWLESAILFESGFDQRIRFNRIVCVTAPTEVRVERIMKRDNISREKALAWIGCQMSQDEMVRRSNFVINNDGLTDLDDQIELLLNPK